MSIAENGVPKMQLVLISLHYTNLPHWSLPVIQTRAWYPNKRRLPAEWPERLKSRWSGWIGAAAIGSNPLLSTFFSFSFLFSFSPLSLHDSFFLDSKRRLERERERERERVHGAEGVGYKWEKNINYPIHTHSGWLSNIIGRYSSTGNIFPSGFCPSSFLAPRSERI